MLDLVALHAFDYYCRAVVFKRCSLETNIN